MELSAYIPMDRRQAMARGEELPDRTSGAALFADISGFTPLTELLARELGPRRGAEELTKQLNIVYDALIAEVHRYGGSVINFSGDAITCWFGDAPSDSGQAGLKAAACALNMQRAMGQFADLKTPSGTPVPLSIKAALAAGPARRFLAGDPQIQVVDVLAGATVDRLARAERQAKAKEIVVGLRVASLLEGAVEVREWRGDAGAGERFAVIARLACQVETSPWPAAPALTEEQARPWLLPPVYRRLKAGQSQFLAELRPAVALFLEFGGLDYDRDAAAGEKLDAYVRWVQHVLARYEGHLVQLTTGDKGSYLYAAFGAPVAHGDDAVRAVAAAVELRSPPPGMDFIVGVQIGISQGRARVGAYGSPARRTYGALGDEVNVAARLMGMAKPGQVLASKHVTDAAAGRYDFEALGAVALKGKRLPVPIFLVLGPRPPSLQRPATLFKSTLVGRDDELARIEQVLESVPAGEGRVLRLEGAAGVGKSHLAAEFVERARGRGFQVVVGACQSTGQAAVYAPWRQAFRALFGLADEPVGRKDPTPLISRQVAQVEEAVGDMNPAWLLRLPLLGDLLGLPIPDNETTSALDPRLRRESLQALAVELVQARAQERPLLLLVEDAHWMDEASLGLTLALGRAIGQVPILLVLVHRPFVEEGTSLLPELDRLPYYDSLDLRELTPQGVGELVANRLGERPSALALSLIQALGQGNPFFTEELVDALRESGELYPRDDGVWVLSGQMFDTLRGANCLAKVDGEWALAGDAQLAAADLGIPDSIQGIVLSRVDRLSESHQLTLKVASVVGRVFEFDLLAGSHPAQPDRAELLAQMEVLEARDFTRLEAEHPWLTYMFKHNITQEVAYQSLLEDQLRRLHRAVGEALEGLQPGAVERLAYYYSHSGLRDKTLFYLDEAARKAQREYANETALAYYDRALALEERWEWLKGKVEVLHVLGRREEEQAALEALETTPGVPVFDAAYLWGQYHEAMSDFAEAQIAVERALSACRDQSDVVGEVRCLNQLGAIAGRQGDFGRAEGWYSQALGLLHDEEALSDGEARVLAQVLNNLGVAYVQQGRFDEAKAHWERALKLSRGSGSHLEEAQALNNLGGLAFYQRSLAEALAHHQQALEIRRAIGDRTGEGKSLYNLALAVRDAGDYAQAQECLSETLVIQQVTGDRWMEANVWNELGVQHLLLGDLPASQTCLQRALKLSREIGDEAGQAYNLCNLGQVLRDIGDLKAAEQLLADGLALAQKQDDRYLMSLCLSHLGAVSLLTGRTGRAIGQANKALKMRRELDLPLWTTADLATLAMAHLASGDIDTAMDYARQALAILEECDGEGPEFPQRDYFVCYQVLSAAGQKEAARTALRSAYNLVMAKAEKITDPDLRQSFLKQVRFNREIVHDFVQACETENV